MRNWFWVILAFLAPLPGLYPIFAGMHLDKDAPLVGSFLFGVGIVGAAFLLSWACEVAQMDIPAALALSVLALIAVLPEYAISFTLAYQGGLDPTSDYAQLTVASMVGANRMIVGFAWPLIIFLFWLRFRKREVNLEKSQRVEIGFLGIAGIYSLTIPFKGYIDFIDMVVLIALFLVYTYRLMKAEVHEPELLGPAETIGSLPSVQRRGLVIWMLVYAGFVIFVMAHPFAESLIITGKNLGVGEVFMVQWFAPLASEAPEIVVCVLFTLRGLASAGLGTLVASKVNQWTLLVGTLPLVFSLGAGQIRSLPLDGEQVGGMFVTSGQTMLAVAIMLNLTAHLWEAGLLFGLFVAQFLFPDRVAGVDTHIIFGTIYLVLAIVLLFRLRHELVPTVKSMFDFRRHPKEGPITEEDKARKHALDAGVDPAELAEAEASGSLNVNGVKNKRENVPAKER